MTAGITQGHRSMMTTDFKWYLRTTGLSGALALLPTTVLTQLAQVQIACSIGTCESTGVVIQARATELLFYVLLLGAFFLLRRTLATPLWILVSCLLATAGLLWIAIAPGPIALIVGLLPTALYSQATGGLRSVVSSRFRDQERAQSWVQAWLFTSFTLMQGGFALTAASPLGWRLGAVWIALLVAAQGVLYMIYRKQVPHPATEYQPGRNRPLADLPSYRPVLMALANLSFASLAFEVIFTKVDVQLTNLGWAPAIATAIGVGVQLGRVASLPIVRRTTSTQGRLMRSLYRSSALILASGVFAVLTTLIHDRWLGTAAIFVTLWTLEGGLNSQNIMIRAYVGEKSLDGATLIALASAIAVFFGSQVSALPFFTPEWAFLACAGISVVCAELNRRMGASTYDARDWSFDLPAVDLLRLRTQPPTEDDPHVELRLTADGCALRPRTLGDGDKIVGNVDWDQATRERYWIPQFVVRVLWGVKAARMLGLTSRLGAFLNSRRWPTRRWSGADRIVLLDNPARCFRWGRDLRTPTLIPGAAVRTRPLLQGRVGRWLFGAPVPGTDGRRYGWFRSAKGGDWAIVELIEHAAYVDPTLFPYYREDGVWELDPRAWTIEATVPALEVRAPFEPGTVQAVALHH
jgi:hypothetical protein